MIVQQRGLYYFSQYGVDLKSVRLLSLEIDKILEDNGYYLV